MTAILWNLLYDNWLSWRRERTQADHNKVSRMQASLVLDKVCCVKPSDKKNTMRINHNISNLQNKGHLTFVRPSELSAGDLSDKVGTKTDSSSLSIYIWCTCGHTFAICCGNGDKIWLTAVWIAHKEDRSVPSPFHSWSKPPAFIFLQKLCVMR